MNRANKSIGWTDYTWNPIKGLCPVGCWYCYARKIYKRFDLMGRWAGDPYWDRDFPVNNDTIFIDDHETNQPYVTRVEAKREIKPRKIFACSTIEMFHPKIPKEFRDEIFRVIKRCPQDTFQILTKMPKNIDRKMPDNVWLGCTVTGEPREMDRNKLDVFGDIKARIKFVSYEPILGYVPFEMTDDLDWLILGRLTGYGKRYDYRVYENIENIKKMIWSYRKKGTKIFMKDNLKEILGERLIQEFPDIKRLSRKR